VFHTEGYRRQYLVVSALLHADAADAICHAADGVAGGAVLLCCVGAAEPAACSAADTRRSTGACVNMDPTAPDC
jgi:hypothetical protein